MANYEAQMLIGITDVNGDSAVMKVTIDPSDSTTIATMATQVANLVSLVAVCTNGKVTMSGLHILFTRAQINTATAPPPASGVYPSVTDGARLTFSNSAGGSRVVVIPAPLLSDFKTGTNTVNPADTNMAPLIAGIIALGDLSGATNLYQGGVKVGHHSRRRATRKSL